MKVLNGRLAQAEWLAGDEYTIADMAMLPYLGRKLAEEAGHYPHVERWATAMKARPAVKKSRSSSLSTMIAPNAEEAR